MLKSSFIRFDKYILNLLFFNFLFILLFFFILLILYSLFLMNGPQTLYAIPGCFKCISGINLPPANENLFVYYFIYFIHLKEKRNFT